MLLLLNMVMRFNSCAGLPFTNYESRSNVKVTCLKLV